MVGAVFEFLGALIDIASIPSDIRAWRRRCRLKNAPLEFVAANPYLFPSGAWSPTVRRPKDRFHKIWKQEPHDSWGLIVMDSAALVLWCFSEDGVPQKTEIKPPGFHLTFGVKEPFELGWTRWIEVQSNEDRFYLKLRRGFESLGAESHIDTLHNLAHSLYGGECVK